MREFAAFLASHDFPLPLVSATVSVAAQALAAVLILTGYRIRIASLVMVANFVVAIGAVHLRNGDSVEATTPAYAMLFGCLTLLFTGAGALTLQRLLKHA
jgi:putative oxidoreductase